MNCIFLRRGYPEIEKAPEIFPAFADNEWSTIIYACQNNLVPSTWAVANSIPMLINGTNYQIDIIGKGHDTYSDGSGKAPLTLQLHDCYETMYNMNSSRTNAGGWSDCAMRKTHLPAIMSLMPSEVQLGIKEVNKLTSAGNKSTTIVTTADKLFLLSVVEAFDYFNGAAATGEGEKYAYYTAGNSLLKDENINYYGWWWRSPYISTNNAF